MKHLLVCLFVLGLVSSCGGNDVSPPAPEAVSLVFPLENSECTTGEPVNENFSRVTFEWEASANTDTYTLTALNLGTNSPPQTISTASTSASLTINKGTPYSWTVTSRNSGSDQTANSATWLFYNAGPQTTYAPFPAQLVHPVSGATIHKNSSNVVVLQWVGADVENDIETFEVFFSDQDPPTASLGILNSSAMEVAASVESGTVYYWRVVSTDAEGNISNSPIFDFKVF